MIRRDHSWCPRKSSHANSFCCDSLNEILAQSLPPLNEILLYWGGNVAVEKILYRALKIEPNTIHETVDYVLVWNFFFLPSVKVVVRVEGEDCNHTKQNRKFQTITSWFYSLSSQEMSCSLGRFGTNLYLEAVSNIHEIFVIPGERKVGEFSYANRFSLAGNFSTFISHQQNVCINLTHT